jgi:hypothetical protein
MQMKTAPDQQKPFYPTCNAHMNKSSGVDNRIAEDEPQHQNLASGPGLCLVARELPGGPRTSNQINSTCSYLYIIFSGFI